MILLKLLEYLPLVFDLIQGCTEDEPTDAQLVDAIRHPAPGAVLRMGRQYRRDQGWSRREWRRNRSSVLAEIANDCAQLSDEACADLIAEYREEKETTAA